MEGASAGNGSQKVAHSQQQQNCSVNISSMNSQETWAQQRNYNLDVATTVTNSKMGCHIPADLHLGTNTSHSTKSTANNSASPANTDTVGEGVGDVKPGSKAKWHSKRNSIHVTMPNTPSSDSGDRVSLDFSNLNDVSPVTPITPSSMHFRHFRQPAQVVHNFPSAPYRRLKHPADRSLCCMFLCGVVFCIASLILVGPFIVVLVLTLPICYYARKLFLYCCCCLKPGACACCCADLMTDTELLWYQTTSRNAMVVQSLVTLEHGLNTFRIQDLVDARLISAETKGGKKIYPRFTQKVVSMPSGYAWIKDPEFSMQNHLFNVPNSVQSAEDLQDYVADMASKPLSMDHPLWEMHVLTDFGECLDTVLLFRMHPCMTDGISLVRILFKAVVDNHSICNLKPRFAGSLMCLNSLRSLLVGPLVFLQKWIYTRRDFNLLHGDHIHLSGKMAVAWSESFSLSCAMRIKQVARATLNDVLMSVAAGCLRNYMQCNGIRNPYDLQVVIPVDLRSDGASIAMGNQYTFLNMTLPTNTEGIVPRLWEFKLHMSDTKNSADSAIISSLTWISSYLFSGNCFKGFWSTFFNKFTCVVSNLPGPESSLTFASREIKSIVYWIPPRDEMAVSISFMSYADQLRMSVIADRSVIPNPELLTREFLVQMDTLSKLLANRRLPGEHISKRLEAMHLAQAREDDPSLEEIHMRMSEIQQHLQELKYRLDAETDRKHSEDEAAIIQRIEQLKGEFRELMVELRRRRMSQGSCMLSDEEEEEEDELIRRPFRRRTMSITSKQSTTSVSSTARPLTTSPAPHQPFIPCVTGQTSAGPSLASVHEEVTDVQRIQIHTYHSQHRAEVVSPDISSTIEFGTPQHRMDPEGR